MTSRMINLIICAGNFSIWPLFALPSFRRENYCVRCSGQQSPYAIIFNEIRNLDSPSRQCTICCVIVRVFFFGFRARDWDWVYLQSQCTLPCCNCSGTNSVYICSIYIAIYGASATANTIISTFQPRASRNLNFRFFHFMATFLSIHIHIDGHLSLFRIRVPGSQVRQRQWGISL